MAKDNIELKREAKKKFEQYLKDEIYKKHKDEAEDLKNRIKAAYDNAYNAGNLIVKNFKDISDIPYDEFPVHLIRQLLDKYEIN